WLTVFIESILLELFTACSSDDEKTEIELAEVTRYVFYTPQYVALVNGFFKEKGLYSYLLTIWVGDKMMSPLLSRIADLALVGSGTSIYVYGQEATDPAINFAQLTQTDGTFLVGKEEQPDFSWDDVEDSSFLGQRKGGMPQMVGEFVLKDNGIDPHEDVD